MKNIETLRHSASHIMAQAVMRLYGNVKIGIGPSIEDGFYYDFEFPEALAEESLDKIAAEMKKISAEKQDFKKEIISKQQAEKIFTDQPYKIELLKDIIENEEITIYRNAEFVDLCRGPHIKNTSEIQNFKILKIAGAYWKGSEKNKMLTRIYGTVFSTNKELKDYLERIKAAKERDHRKLGRELELFSIHPDTVGSGLVFWHPKGAAVRRVIEDFWVSEHLKNGYELINIPHIANSNLWKISGHLDFYSEYIYPPMALSEEQKYILKPMNCPGHIIVYKHRSHSYREFPIRWAELGTVYRYEKIGVLHGLMRVRGFTQDDAHIFCRTEDINEELAKIFEFVIHILSSFGFSDYEVFLSTRPEKYTGELKQWEIAENALKKGLQSIGLDFKIDPGEGVFYGPKVDIKIKDSLGRLWQCSTIQLDFNIPQKFELDFVNKKGEKEQPVMIHRAIFGSLERFFGILIEHYGGRFPLWLAPVQVELLPISEKHFKYCFNVQKAMLKEGIRVKINNADDKLGKKIWHSRKMQVPYTVVVGDKEIENNKISVRNITEGDIGNFDVKGFISILKKEINLKK